MTTQAENKKYYAQGSAELAKETPVMMKRLEKRRRWTSTNAMTLQKDSLVAERLLIVLVGLPARGKSFISRKLQNYMLWRGNRCRIFNVGKYRRAAATSSSAKPQHKADFFDDNNVEANRLRQQAAHLALQDTLEWLHGNDAATLAALAEGDVSVTSFTTGATTEDDDDTTTDDSSQDFFFTSGHQSHGARRQFHRIAIFDATNTTNERRQWILRECAKADHKYNSMSGGQSKKKQPAHQEYHQRTGVLFLESICDDQELLKENFQVKIRSSPDFEGMTEEEALQDLQARVKQYEARYETIQDPHQSYIKIFNLSSRLHVNHVYGRLAKVVLPAIMAWNTGSRPIYLCRAGETKAMEEYMKDLSMRANENGEEEEKKDASTGNKSNKIGDLVNRRHRRRRADRLGERGLRFRDALADFIQREGELFMDKQLQNTTSLANSTDNIKKTSAYLHHPSKVDTGTSISGLKEEQTHSCTALPEDEVPIEKRAPQAPSFPCLVLSSTMPRAIETATWSNHHEFPVKDVSNLNPLDMGDFSGMDLATIKEQYPEWYQQLQQEPFHTRFPGGESYSDLIDRLYSTVIDIEEQLGLAVAVSHVSALQALISYFRGTPIHECMDIEIPMHTVFKFVPLRGGGWLESQHLLLKDEEHALDQPEPLAPLEPIWGDSRSCLPHRL
eukprot:CAMPEP_0176143664 /NCGR_PEP_ID=MMETSP0120_2-20121206/73128_1 /TAXON_ID=160619 /ORGANISM="Kryptoperidinium foliaceum, Strain CCMP 1326" /LENGTH=672 /DNA_ID=CAMNT_0017479989 /DNA_START=11 /DNA_END=2029 /DNA_ORIENTATION=+